MPIFQKKFAPKLIPPRTRRLNIGCPAPSPADDVDDFRSITLNLVDRQLCFIDGVWMNGLQTRPSDAGPVPGPGAGSSVSGGSAATAAAVTDDMMRMRRRLKTVEQENNLLQVKLDVLVDLLTENMIELNGIKNQ
ncbi:protein chibby homolog 1 [Anopheles aquasalis]|uniref:protein chibby homolog 1 n=1 Tax=Anopheles aquasalis TaxID=42839 RepID=UPI00215B746E|nr:protein chibby homolog 1 [Anopheles aquasalis]